MPALCDESSSQNHRSVLSFGYCDHFHVSPKWSHIPVADLIKLFFFANEDIFRVFAGKLPGLLHTEKK